VRAGTPSIAAEIVVPVKTELIQQVKDLSARLARAPQHAGETFAQRIDHLTLRLSAALRDCAARAETRLARPAQRLLPALKEAVSRAEKRLSLAERCLSPAMKEAISGSERRLVAAQAKLDLLDPSNPLKRGYSLTLDAEGRIVRSASSVNVGDTLTTRLGEGQIVSTVTKS
jgi:exodeoxyribonuclease VII large subunit